MKTQLILFLFLSCFAFSRQFVIKDKILKTSIENVLVMDKNNQIIGKTNSNGAIQLSEKEPFYILFHQDYDVDTIFSKNFHLKEHFLNPMKTKDIEEVVMNVQVKDFVLVEGYFNNYISLNGSIIRYNDGILQYIFNRKTKKLHAKNIIQYRSFSLQEEENEDNYAKLRLPDFKFLGKLDEKSYTKSYLPEKEITIVKDKSHLFVDKPFKLFGIHVQNFISTENISFKGEKINPNKLMDFHNIVHFEGKRKKDTEFQKFESTTYFQTHRVKYVNKNEIPKGISFDKQYSQYTEPFWENTRYKSNFSALSKIFKKNLKEVKNKF